jgi:general secretion pathway protein D
VPLDPHRVLVAKDTRANRQEYERLLLETVYLPGLNTQEITDVSNLARNVLEIQQVAAEPSKNTLSVRGPETRLALFNRTLHGLMDGRSQVLLEVRIYEIQRTRNLNVGVQLPQQFNAFNLNTEIQNVLNNNQQLIQEIVSSGLANANDLEAIAAILIASGQVAGNSILTQPFAVFGGGLTATGLTLGTITVNAGLNTSDSRAIDQLQLRLQDQETGDILAGIRYPIIQSSYSNLTGVGVNIPGLNTPGLSSQLAALGINGSSLNAQTIPQVQYQDLGLQMKTTPYIHRDQSVSLKLDLKVQALGGSSINQIPILTNRQFTAALDLKDGESALVTSDLSSQEARAVSGLPGLSEIPGLQSTTNKEVQRSNDELVVLITPHVVRLPHPSGASQVMLLPTHQ